jgi:transposase
MSQSTPFVGLDVHASQTHAGIFEPLTGELRRRRLNGEPLVVLPFLEQLGAGVCAVYEAGPTGFGLARAAAECGLDVRVCAPGLIPRKPSDRVKTDARDAERLARLLAAGELSFVRVPAVEEEQLRDLVRAREDLRGDLAAPASASRTSCAAAPCASPVRATPGPCATGAGCTASASPTAPRR